MRPGLSKTKNGYSWWCPGCKEYHGIPVGNPSGLNWDFDGNESSPTFSPSILIRGVRSLSDDEHRRVMSGERIKPTPRQCHFHIVSGTIRFCGDCTHALSGKTVPLEPFPESTTNPFTA